MFSSSKVFNGPEIEQQKGEEEREVQKDLFEEEKVPPVNEDKGEELYLNNNINTDSEESSDENNSNDESFYSFESETEHSERRVAFGSVKSLVEEEHNHTIERRFCYIFVILIRLTVKCGLQW